MHIAVIDIGKPNHNLGWAIVGPEACHGTDLDECIDRIVDAVSFGPVALGFEAPMFVPVRDDPDRLTKARAGECEGGVNRPFSAGPGSSVLVTATVVVPYVLSRLRERLPDAQATLDWRDFGRSRDHLLLFEAFVSNRGARANSRHVEDARSAAEHLRKMIESGDLVRSAIDEPNCFSIIRAIILRTGWAKDLQLLSEQCLVVRP